MKVTIVIPTYNRPAQVEDLIDYLINTIMFKGQIIVVDQSDNHPRSNTLAFSSQYSNVSYHFSQTKGTSKARNVGATYAQSEWLCFLDDDVRPAVGFFDEALSFLGRNDWIDVLQPELLQYDIWTKYRSSPDKWIQNYHRVEKKSRETPARRLDAVQWFLQKPSSPFETLALSIGSGAFFINRETFLRVGGFDENLSGSGDDRELIVRLWWYGYRTYFFPTCVAFHLHDETGGLRSKLAKRTFPNIFRPEPDPGIIYFYQKWFPGYPSACFYLYYLVKHRNYFLLPIRLLRLLHSASLANQLIKKGPQYCLGVQPRHRASLDVAKCDSLQNTTSIS